MDAVIVATARTPLGKSYRGALNATHGAALGAAAINAALSRAGLDGSEVDDVLMGCACQEAATGSNIARQAAIRAGLPLQIPGATIDRKCASGLQAIVAAADRIRSGEADVIVAGGLEALSLVQTKHRNRYRSQDAWIAGNMPAIYWNMIQTADLVATRYGISRDAQDEYAAESQARTARAQAAGAFDAEITSITALKDILGPDGDVVEQQTVTIVQDECNRPGTTLEGLLALKPVNAGGTTTAGNASQISDGASACVLMSARAAAQRGLQPLGVFRGFEVVGCHPEEMGIGPVFAVPKLLARHGLQVDDIGLWELNEAFAVQVIY